MTQTSLAWLITAPEGESFSQNLTVACRGNDRISGLLNALLYEAAIVVKNLKLNPKELEFVRMNLNLDKLIGGLKRLNRSASKQTIIEWRKKFEEWGFLQFDGHRQQYDLYFHKIEDAIKQRPPKEATPRGRHAPKKKRDSSVESTDSTLDNGEIQASTIRDSSVEGRDSSFDFETEIQAWRDKTLKLESHISKVESEMSKLESLYSHEVACREALEGKVEALYNLVNNLNNIILNEKKGGNDDPPISSNGEDSFIHSSDMNLNLSPKGGSPASDRGGSFPPSNLATELPKADNSLTNVGQFPDGTLNLDTQPFLPDPVEGCASPPPQSVDNDLANAPAGENGAKNSALTFAPQHNSLQQANQNVAEPLDTMLQTPPQPVMPNATFPIVLQTDAGASSPASPNSSNSNSVEPPDNDAPSLDMGGYKKDYDQGDSDHDDCNQVVVTQEILLGWITKAGVALGLPASCDKAVKVLLPLVKCEQTVIDLIKIEREIHPKGVIYVSNLAKPAVTNALEESRQSQPLSDEIPAHMGMSRAEFDEVGTDIQSVGLYLLYGQSEGTGRYFIGIADSDTTQIDINRPNDWWHLSMDALQRALNYAQALKVAVVREEAIAL
jgi:hypothetical protein